MKYMTLIVLLSGCDNRHELGRYKCNDAQWKQAEQQTDYCIEKTMLYPSVCLIAAKQTLCEYQHPFIEEQPND
jgi:hypothetical protein